MPMHLQRPPHSACHTQLLTHWDTHVLHTLWSPYRGRQHLHANILPDVPSSYTTTARSDPMPFSAAAAANVSGLKSSCTGTVEPCCRPSSVQSQNVAPCMLLLLLEITCFDQLDSRQICTALQQSRAVRSSTLTSRVHAVTRKRHAMTST